MRLHIYFAIRGFMRKFEVINKTQTDSLLRKYNAGFRKDHYAKWTWQESLHTEDPNGGVTPQNHYRLQNHPGPGSIRDVQNDYKKFISKTSYGFTSNGLELLNQSIEAHLHSILGAQARSGQAIINNSASSLVVQQIFRQIVEDSIINYDKSTWINNVNRSISDTNVVLNMAISQACG